MHNVIGPRISTQRPVNCIFASTMTHCSTPVAPFILYAISLRSHPQHLCSALSLTCDNQDLRFNELKTSIHIHTRAYKIL